ncbi:Spermatogenesis-associated protein 31E1 [Manis javanica]|nr:Spermatogenesis-associated protein 31E1 [Manis javanica]
MESPLLSLRSGLATWLSSSPTSWGPAVTAGILCGLGLLLLQVLFFPFDAPSPPPRNIREPPLEPREKNRWRRKRREALRGCRVGLRRLEVASSLLTHPESLLSRILDKSGDHRSRQDPPGENKPQSLIAPETRHPERPTLQKQPEGEPCSNTEAESELKPKEGKAPIQHPTLSVMGGSCQNGTMEQARRGGPELSPCSAMVRDEQRKDSGGQASRTPVEGDNAGGVLNITVFEGHRG